jgi:molybdate transport system substrate-binding protein
MVLRILAVLVALAVSTAASAAEVRVFAAASLTGAMKEIAPAFERATGERLVMNFAASSTLARQLVEGAPCDVFLSADEEKMDGLERRGLLLPGSRFAPLSNALVVVVPDDVQHPVKSARDLASPRIRRLALAEMRSVPAGVYARIYLQNAGVWKTIESRVVPTDNVRSALAAVEAGNADAAIVYATDARVSKKTRVAFQVPPALAPPITYPFAALRDSTNKRGARRLLEYLRSSDARRIFAKHGFLLR